MTAIWHCWPKIHAVSALKQLHHVHRTHRIGRAVKRAGGIAISKPAIIAWTCLALWWPAPVGHAIAPPQIWPSSDFAPFLAGIPQEITGNSGPFGISPTEFPIIGPPVLLPDVPLVPESPTTPAQPVPEPSSLSLLLPALSVFVLWRSR